MSKSIHRLSKCMHCFFFTNIIIFFPLFSLLSQLVDEHVSDSDSSVGSTSHQYPMLSTPVTDAPSIGIQPQVKKWSKYHSCFYCDKQIIKMARHLEMKHKSELSVGQILSLPKGSNERRKGWLKIIKEGDYKHNFDVFDKGEGTLIPKYRGKNVQIETLVPCPTCKGLYRKKKIAAHSQVCCTSKPGRAYREGSLMLPVPKNISKSLWQNVLLKMKDDPISRKAKSDSLIIAFGERMYHKRDVEEHTSSQISGRMRELARLVMDLKDRSNGNIESLTDALLVKNFDTLVASVRSVAEYSDETHSFGKGSLALKLGYSIKKSAFILKSHAIQNSDQMQIANAEKFLSLFTGNWCDHISSAANQSLERRKFNNPQLLPCCRDVEKLYSYVKNIKADDYPTVAKAALCEISLFNRKRGGEVQRMTLENLEMGKKNQEPVDEEIIQSLTPIERKLVQSFTRIEIRGKFNRRVAILLTHSMLTKIDTIMLERERLSIKSKYLFATPNGERPYRGSDVIRVMAIEAGVSSPYIFTWTSLRKQVATISQALEISDIEQDQLAQFLGHDIRVHRDFYRLPHDILQKAKVAKILMKINAGKSTSVEDYSLEDDNELEPDDSCSGESDLDEEEKECYEDTQESGPSEIMELDAFKERHEPKHEGLNENSSDTRKSGKRRKWTQVERQAVLKHLSVFIRMKKVPGKADIEKAINREQCLNARSWRNVKDFCYNEIKKL